MKLNIAVLIMAAGKASRFGSCKQLVSFNSNSVNNTVLQHVIDVANSVFDSNLHNHTFAVTGYYHNEISEQIKDAQLIYNPDWEKGLGCSISHGVKVLSEKKFDGILILLADQVAISSSHLKKIQSGFNGKNIVCARYQGANGVPALFPKSYFNNLKELKGDKGAKKLLNMKPNKSSHANPEILSVDIQEAGIDIDTPDDLKKYINRLQKYS